MFECSNAFIDSSSTHIKKLRLASFRITEAREALYAQTEGAILFRKCLMEANPSLVNYRTKPAFRRDELISLLNPCVVGLRNALQAI